MRDYRWRDEESRNWDDDASGQGGRGYGQRGRGDQGRYRGEDDRSGQYGRGGHRSDFDRDRGGQYGQGRFDQDPDFGRRSIGGGFGQGGYGEGGYEQGTDRGGYGGMSGYGGSDYGRRGYGQGRSGGYGDYDRGMDYGNRGTAGYGGPDYGSYGYGRQGYGNRDDWRGPRERGWWDRATDEVASWMGDEDADRRRRMDESRGGHQGRGPKGYTRSDDRIREDVNDRLTDDYRVDAGEIEVSVSGGEVTLSGTVRSRDDKRRAEDIAEAVSGVKHVQNNVRVKQDESSSSFGEGDRIGSGSTSMAGTGRTGTTSTAGGTTTRSPV
jgi:osmotically-inducible protein OsmY